MKQAKPDDCQAELTVKSRDEDYFGIVSAPSALLKARGMLVRIAGFTVTFSAQVGEINCS